jgi:dihydroorotase
VDDKKVEFDQAAFGIVGLETAVALGLDRLVRGGIVGLSRLVALFSTNPARVLGLPGGSLAVGMPGDVTILDLERERTVDPARFQTKGRNTPYGGWTLRGWPVATIVGGRVAWQDAAVRDRSRTPARRKPAVPPAARKKAARVRRR